MPLTFPSDLEQTLTSYIKRSFYPGTRREAFIDRPFTEQDLRFFATGARKLSELFTSERNERSDNYLGDPKLRAGYLLYFLPLNFCKTKAILEKIPKNFWDNPEVKILDLGCGPGTVALALIDLMNDLQKSNLKLPKKIEIFGVDQNLTILKDAQNLVDQVLQKREFQKTGIHLSFHFYPVDFRRLSRKTPYSKKRYDLVIASHFLNEWQNTSTPLRAQFFNRIGEENLHKTGLLILIEPALQQPSRDLMHLRNALVETKQWSIFAPCLHHETCPMLIANSRDWCHFYFFWQKPEWISRLERLIETRNDFLKCAYFIFNRRSLSELDFFTSLKRPTEVYRVVSNGMKTKGKGEVVVCGPNGRWHLVRFDRDEQTNNKDFAALRRGDLVWVPKLEKQTYEISGRIRLEVDDLIQKVFRSYQSHSIPEPLRMEAPKTESFLNKTQKTRSQSNFAVLNRKKY